MKNNNETLHIERTLQKAIMAAFRLADDHDQLPPSATCAGRKHAGTNITFSFLHYRNRFEIYFKLFLIAVNKYKRIIEIN